MRAWPRNEFGPVLFGHDPILLAEQLGIQPKDRVLDLGGAANPFARADVICDLTFGESAQRNGAPGTFRDGLQYVEAAAEHLPFPDQSFDFVWCTQVLEHVKDPIRAAAELSRVARRGFIEVPSRLGEVINGNPTHRWIVDLEGQDLVFQPRTFIEHPLHNFFYGVHFGSESVGAAAEGPYRNLFNHQLMFGEEGLQVRVLPADGVPFDYDDPKQAARAHYSFARNCLLGGAATHYAYPDAELAVRYAPNSVAARCLLAVYQARLLRFHEARATLVACEDQRAKALDRLIQRAEEGAGLDPKALPLPAEATLEADATPWRPPSVAILCAGADPELLADAVTSALTQDHPAVQVVAAGPIDPAETRWQRFQMAGRLTLVPRPKEEGLGAWLNAAAGLCPAAEWIGFCLAGDRLMAHHVARALDTVSVGGGDAVLGHCLLETTAKVLPGMLDPGNPALAGLRLSALLIRRDTALSQGFFDAARGEDAPEFWLAHLARRIEAAAVGEITVRSRSAPKAHATLLELGESGLLTNGFEMARDLIASIARERGLEAKIQELEARLERLGEKP